ncbi:MAG: prepilin-type N-terminal cleavage/methylation domain-containing protein [Phycisphaeraceae bacterium]|nr:prepilin-type N-terminal cleavage/methylation domain-containing protein [Phycisphaeraceae bacterium]MCB9847936.1 prepilin-type N-terminal cleavage/methylation domain-containing protein [Phycisphaeraceae bacterium]
MNPGVRASRAFTIIEMIIVLTVLGLVVGITAPRLIGSGADARARGAVRGVVDTLTAERAETIRSMRPARLYLVSGRDRGADAPTLRLFGVRPDSQATGEQLMAMLTQRGAIGEPFFELGEWEGVEIAAGDPGDAKPGAWRGRAVLIDPQGRTSVSEGGGAIALVAARGGGRIWRIGFDPISGVPSLVQEQPG